MNTDVTNSKGSIVCVGIGMTLGSHLTPLARDYIEQSDVVFSLVSDGIVEQWINEMHPDVRSLQPYYQDGLSRALTYLDMVNAMLSEVKKGKRVVGAFYGHPGVFACVPHLAIKEAKAQGYFAQMEPGISAEDCLFADLAIDPGEYGCAHYEASQFMMFKRHIDPSAYLILWQIGIAGDTTLTKRTTGTAYRKVLIDLLLEHYQLKHKVILYEAPTLAIYAPRDEEITLGSLLNAEINGQTTLVIPPAQALQRNHDVISTLENINTENNNVHLIN